MGLAQSRLQYPDSHYVRSIAWDVIQRAGAADPRSRVIALRDYLQANVSLHGAPVDHRPFLRASATETLRSRKGLCGEVTRTFIVMAEAVGIRAQRINLWGTSPHVVAEVELGPGDKVLVDAQNPPRIAGLERLDRVILRDGYDDYYTLNLRRLGLNAMISRIKIEMGPLTYWTENPHALQALLWFLLALALVVACLAIQLGRACVRYCLHRRGWVHISNAKVARQTVHGKGDWPV